MPTAQRAGSRQTWRRLGTAGLPALGVCALFMLTLLLAVSFAQTAGPSGEELYVDRLGCWNCHGTAGRGGEAHSIAKTQLPLRKFIKHVRLPSGQMPPVPALMATDGELATLYQWLGGVDALEVPPSIAVDLKGSRVTINGSALVETRVELGSAKTEARSGADIDAPLQYRVTLLTAANVPATDQAVEYQSGGRGEWSKVTLDQQGEAVLGPDRILDSARGTQKRATMLLRTALAAGKYALVFEVVDRTDAANPVVVGVGTAILKVE